jgi:hypothetical protein
MTEQIAVRLDDALAEHARAEAAAAGATLSDWVRGAIRHQVALATALRARAQEDARPPLHTEADEDALSAARRTAAWRAFDDPDGGDVTGIVAEGRRR